MSHEELMGWLAYYQRHGSLMERADVRSAIVAHAAVSVHIPRGKKSPKLEDFMAAKCFDKPSEPPSGEELARKIMAGMQRFAPQKAG